MAAWLRIVSALLFAIVLALAAACGASSLPGPDATDGGTSLPNEAASPPGAKTQAIGPEGGTITSADGRLSLEFPAGALAAATEISIAAFDAAKLGPSWATARDGAIETTVYEIGPAGLTFAVPVGVRFASTQAPLQADGSVKVHEESLWTAADANGEPTSLADPGIRMADDGKLTIAGSLAHFSLMATFKKEDHWTATLLAPSNAVIGQTVSAYLRLESSKGRAPTLSSFQASALVGRMTLASPATGTLSHIAGYTYGVDLALTCVKLGQETVYVTLDWQPFSSTFIRGYTICIEESLLYVKTAGDGTGLATSTPAGISCADPNGLPVSCSAQFTFGTKVSLTATPDPGSLFESWTVNGATLSTPTITIDMNDYSFTAIATFKKAPNVTLSVSTLGDGEGTVTSNVGGINCTKSLGTCIVTRPQGEKITLTQQAANGSTFTSWGGVASGNGASVEVTLAASNNVVTATFTKNAVVVVPGDYIGLLIKSADAQNHDQFVFNAGAGGKAASVRAAVNASTITITALTGFTPSALPTLTGTLNPDNTFQVDGIGTVAGYPSVQVRGLGSIDATGKMTIVLEVGRNTTLPDGSITYNVSGTK